MKIPTLALSLAVLIASATTVAADSDDAGTKFRAELSGYHEVHFIAAPTPALRGAVSTPAHGTFHATIDDRAQIIRYELSYEGLQDDASQAHIHFGQRHTVGGIVVWLCQGTLAAPPAVANLTPTCPPRAGTVTGTITPAQVLTAVGQGLNAGEFDELVKAIRAGATYANVHSVPFAPPGEIRGAILRERESRQ